MCKIKNLNCSELDRNIIVYFYHLKLAKGKESYLLVIFKPMSKFFTQI